MNEPIQNVEESVEAARRVVEAETNARVDAVRAIVVASNEVESLEARLRDAQAAHDSAWQAALRAGWNEKSLRATGARGPGQQGRRPRRREAASAAPAIAGE